MRKLWLLLVAVAGAVVIWKRKPSPSKSGARVLLVGDSLAVGLTVPLKGLVSSIGGELSALAKVGTTLQYWDSGSGAVDLLTSLAKHPEFVLVSLGTNDEYETASDGRKAVSSLSSLLDKFRASGAVVSWIGPPTLPTSYGGNSLNGVVLTAIRSALGARYFDSIVLTIPRQPDGLHPTVSGYSQWASAIFSWWRGLD